MLKNHYHRRFTQIDFATIFFCTIIGVINTTLILVYVFMDCSRRFNRLFFVFVCERLEIYNCYGYWNRVIKNLIAFSFKEV